MHKDSHTTSPATNRIEEMVRDVPGWSPLDQLQVLFGLVFATGGIAGDVIEVGSWCGRSASALGLAAKLTGNTLVHCIDLFPAREDWRRTPEGDAWFETIIDGQHLGGYQTQLVWKEPFERDIVPLYAEREGILEIFKETIARNGLTDVIRPFRGNGAMFARAAAPDLRCRVAFIDGDHGYDEVCADIATIERFLVPGGWICFDDAFSSYEGVNRAIEDRIIKNPNYELGQQMTRKCFIARRKAG
ncbi:MAG: class I SAM-dependent methyltransferase [Candidatus Sericytochromatia bacterium]|nr:class I SAM-dependent methyltransferase [Candidatus Sericytochromatia bacterium]